MLVAWVPAGQGLERVEVASTAALPAHAVWIDALDISDVEERALETRFGIDIPTREEMQEIELSSRLFREGEWLFMASTMLLASDTPAPTRTVVTFILSRDRLITVRYAEPRAFQVFCQRTARAVAATGSSAESAFVGLLEATVERLADLLERIDAQLERVSDDVFRVQANPHEEAIVDLQPVLVGVGRAGNALSKARESLVDKHRLVAYALTQGNDWLGDDAKRRLRTLAQDSQALADQATFIATKVSFLLDATLGLINIDQNKILKIFSVVTVICTPPLIVAGIYGMNFEHMPEKNWHLGYPLALLAMAASAWVPWLIFRRRGWL